MMSSDQDLDESQLAELREDLGDAFTGFVEGFLDGARTLPEGVEASLSAGRVVDVAAPAHQLKGTAGYLGAVKLTETLARLQRAAESEAVDEVRDLVEAFRRDLASLTPRLLACLGQD